ncbi:unnamed protein product [Bursaphelenchus xylophilus]|uniref:Alpha-amylase n=2 Tax=Bursaphelenchus xylophilus TaxID=6326 RepID=A0A7I8WIU5_BURXY|nr:unnamed protein product [Bursaphelenchus xylophilus]CAG9108763.1 unnamed protein product [Bursaphelenchus xylophilus]
MTLTRSVATRVVADPKRRSANKWGMKGIVLFLFLLAPSSDADPYDDTHNIGSRDLMVHLFEWKWNDIAQECENFLSKNGYGAVQISPPNEHIMINENNDVPWFVRYQPVSYQLNSRSGNETELQDMIRRCNAVGVRIIVDVVLNHMVGVNQKAGQDKRWSSGASHFDAAQGVEYFPGVPFNKSDFNDPLCNHDIEGPDYQHNAAHVKECRLVGLLDLNQGKPEVREKMIKYLNNLIEFGVAGFRFDASKHMWPDHLKLILDGMNNLRSDIFGENQRPFVVHEVIDRGGEAVKVDQYLEIGRYTNFNFGAAVASAIRKEFDVAELRNMGDGFRYGNKESFNVLNFIDNHDNQRDEYPYVVTYKNQGQYVQAVAYMLAWNYGYPRIMSSFNFSNSIQGPPNNGPEVRFSIKSPQFEADDTCKTSSGWVCEHRWPQIRRMAKFREEVGSATISEIRTGPHMLAFARSGRGFFALNNNPGEFIEQNVMTTLPPGLYCDLSSGLKAQGVCTGKFINVTSNGSADIYIPGHNFLAISLSNRL